MESLPWSYIKGATQGLKHICHTSLKPAESVQSSLSLSLPHTLLPPSLSLSLPHSLSLSLTLLSLPLSLSLSKVFITPGSIGKLLLEALFFECLCEKHNKTSGDHLCVCVC